MLTTQISDRTLFLKMATRQNAEIVVVRTTTLVPEIEGTRVRMVQALALQYSIRFTRDQSTECWIYREEKPICGERADLAGTLFEQLRARGDLKVRLHYRSGSF